VNPTNVKFTHAAAVQLPTLPDFNIHSSLLVSMFMGNEMPARVQET